MEFENAGRLSVKPLDRDLGGREALRSGSLEYSRNRDGTDALRPDASQNTRCRRCGFNGSTLLWFGAILLALSVTEAASAACGTAWTDSVIPDIIFCADFRPACDRHDACYAPARKLPEPQRKLRRAACDGIFLSDLLDACRQRCNEPTLCILAGIVYYLSAKNLGDFFFGAALEGSPRTFFRTRSLDSTEFIYIAAKSGSHEQVKTLERDVKDLFALNEIDPQDVHFVLSPSNEVLIRLGKPSLPIFRDDVVNGVTESRLITMSFRNYIDVTNMTVGGTQVLAPDGTFNLPETAIAAILKKEFMVTATSGRDIETELATREAAVGGVTASTAIGIMWLVLLLLLLL